MRHNKNFNHLGRQAPDTVAAFGKDAAAYVTGRYNWDAITRQTLNTYKGEDQ